MEKILTLRGLLFGALGGAVAWVFMYIMAEPIIGRAIDYESARDEVEDALEHGHGHLTGAAEAAAHSHGGGDELFSRTVQEGIGAGAGMVLFGLAMGGLAAVILAVWMHYRGSDEARRYVLPVVGLTFAVLYILPTLKYPANPPAVGNSETISQRTGLFLAMVLISTVVVCAGVFLEQKLRPALGVWSVWVSVLAVVVVMAVVYVLMPSLGSLSANADLHSSFETPQPVTDDDGTIVFPGFNADDLYLFRLYSFVAQAIIWSVVAAGLTWGAGKVDALRGRGAPRRDVVGVGA